MKSATYRVRKDGETVTMDFEYDPDAPCRVCGLPVVEASTSGTDVCPACDTGYCRRAERRIDGACCKWHRPKKSV